MDPIRVPKSYYNCDTNYLIHMIADMLTKLMTHNDQIPVTHTNLTRFHSRAPPTISIIDYLKRIIKYASVERACLLAILLYIDRVCERHPSFTISSLTVHRFIIAAITVSAKAICDSYCTNAHYAKVGGISTHELNTLELEFLFLIRWHVASPASVLHQYYGNLVRQYPNFIRSTFPSSSPPPGTLPDTAPRPTLPTSPIITTHPISIISIPPISLISPTSSSFSSVPPSPQHHIVTAPSPSIPPDSLVPSFTSTSFSSPQTDSTSPPQRSSSPIFSVSPTTSPVNEPNLAR